MYRHEEQQHRLSNEQRMSYSAHSGQSAGFPATRGEKESHFVKGFHSADVPLTL